MYVYMYVCMSHALLIETIDNKVPEINYLMFKCKQVLLL